MQATAQSKLVLTKFVFFNVVLGLAILTSHHRTSAAEFPKSEYQLVCILETQKDGSPKQAAKIVQEAKKLRDFMARARMTPEAHQRYSEKIAGLEFLAGLLEKTHQSMDPIDPITLDSTKLPSISGSGGCNRWMSSLELLDGDKLKIAGIAMTRKMCPKEGVMKLEFKFGQVLANSACWSIEGNLLVLKSEKDAAMLLFQQSDQIEQTKVP